MYQKRTIEKFLNKVTGQFPVIMVTGPRHREQFVLAAPAANPQRGQAFMKKDPRIYLVRILESAQRISDSWFRTIYFPLDKPHTWPLFWDVKQFSCRCLIH